MLQTSCRKPVFCVCHRHNQGWPRSGSRPSVASGNCLFFASPSTKNFSSEAAIEQAGERLGSWVLLQIPLIQCTVPYKKILERARDGYQSLSNCECFSAMSWVCTTESSNVVSRGSLSFPLSQKVFLCPFWEHEHWSLEPALAVRHLKNRLKSPLERWLQVRLAPSWRSHSERSRDCKVGFLEAIDDNNNDKPIQSCTSCKLQLESQPRHEGIQADAELSRLLKQTPHILQCFSRFSDLEEWHSQN